MRPENRPRPRRTHTRPANTCLPLRSVPQPPPPHTQGKHSVCLRFPEGCVTQHLRARTLYLEHKDHGMSVWFYLAESRSGTEASGGSL